MGRVQDKAVFITGAARGQGRAHAVRLASEGADIIAVDLCEDIATNGYPLATEADLDETVRQVEKLGRRIVAHRADVRDPAALKAAVAEGVAELGRLDAVVAQAGIAPLGPQQTAQAFLDAVTVDFNGVVHAVDAALPHLPDGASIVATGSIAGLIPATVDNPANGPGGLGYSFAKRQVAAFVHDLATVLLSRRIRVNAVHPTNVNTDMLNSDLMYRSFRPDLENPTREDALPSFPATTGFGVPYVEPENISDMVLFLVSDESQYVTGMQMRVDAGGYVKRRPQLPAF
ncbi:mycofactocin-coupled SDR family oxidoreductase [Streptomyces sp. NPDC059837]|jgi:SDR family mycofactocin-dependent oxidoreductase|uniref:mycofactocin-coupled SDR family oxidoreductase n=1 Tax=unclassified Streptomyces TaxID=2593676 RepID=UPI00224D6A72|nr:MULTISPECIES: mycofactocin-coupled SDR family oxidoreductase [unclassified Streptomyces]MCX4404695.1 mycofactocin-coupled SDR family oxidoreductase [Streptomyces sp. NBC_01764]MCX5095649.1 mycofactocin-coupled SDR family oxidoreductase [Streptomyces sp. NBC_00365]MCX5190759.1 mycofactocin-coupled SDR family oxidoreductase [Streptomyces sp. NBC_00268]